MPYMKSLVCGLYSESILRLLAFKKLIPLEAMDLVQAMKIADKTLKHCRE